jgi:adenine-specific DNA-methyltransferase
MTARRPVARHTPDLVDHRAAILRDLYPEAFSEGRVDFDRLRAALGDLVDDRPERYTFSWAGKRDAIRLLQTPTAATLLPCEDASIDFDATGHLFIEGDNLEALKLLFKPYFGRVKMIYIDPPYNTGNDFIYPDDYADPLNTYLQLTGQRDAQGNLLTSNPETSGRYHSAWLSMIYPRLFLARQLLREDGVIFVSIDDHEVHNLRLLMNEVFGEENFVATFVWRRRMATGMRGEPISPDHEYVLSYARSSATLQLFGTSKRETDYPFADAQGTFRSTDLTVGMTRSMRPNQYYPICNPSTGSEHWPPDERVWRFEPQTMKEHIEADNIIWPDDSPERNMSRPRFKTRYDPDKTSPVSTWINGRQGLSSEDYPSMTQLVSGMNQDATKELRALFEEQLLEYPKPTSLMRSLVSLGSASDDIILDFFAGSCTTAQAVLELNREDGGNRRYIMVQLPEPTGRDDYPTIAHIGIERIRRVVARMRAEDSGKLALSSGAPADLGLRVFRLAPSTLRPWRGAESPDPAHYAEQMALFADPLVGNWRPMDVLWEVALKEGYALDSRVERVDAVSGQTVYRVTDAGRDQSFCICLDDAVSAPALAPLGLTAETLLVCRDVALDDGTAANLALQCRLKTI